MRPNARNAERHDLQFTEGFYEKLSPHIRKHLTCRVVKRLEPVIQEHTIERLVMGEA
jgi:hypothetical protein